MRNAKLINQEIVFNKFKKLVIDKIITHDGKELNWVYLDSPRSVIVVTLTPEKKLLLEKLYRYNLKQDVYENPAGAMDENETDISKAGKRELLEETGYVPEKFINLGKYYVLPGDTNRWVHIFLALNSKKVEEPKLDNIVEQYFDISTQLFDFDEIIKNLFQPNSIIQGIEHAFALTLADNYLKQHSKP
jgi:ADP-ribose pyrophosphatase